MASVGGLPRSTAVPRLREWRGLCSTPIRDMLGIQRELDRVVSGFVQQITELARRAAIERVQRALGAGTVPRERSASRRDGRRTSKELDHLRDQFVAFISSNPGLRIEQINAQLGTTTRDLAQPIQKLIAVGAIKTKGKKRATVYFAK
ncbi:MAG: hypothetical protein JO257_08345 [Deltaproteobacteria bacterium]|nr:hypothetical protein [Deltaproteobacteria bacterium]